mmetsp:Transcript_21310/g.82708  ORF Transcript_21310/g.82708 Transcript_21310/m.82708 type:complete len:90 (+) Transcript_21310:352-621(+)
MRRRAKGAMCCMASKGMEELLDEVMPYVPRACIEQKSFLNTQTPREIAMAMYDRSGDDAFLLRRILADSHPNLHGQNTSMLSRFTPTIE